MKVPPSPPRYAPDLSFPPYAYTGDPMPHPRNHPRGHSRDEPEEIPPALDPRSWQDSRAYLCGIDLFNHGYYWEAHEAWEGLWLAAGKKGPISELMKGLIKLTAAGVKARQSQPDGVRRHAVRAGDHFETTRVLVGEETFAGFSFSDLIDFSRQVGSRADDWPSHVGEEVAIVFDRCLTPK